MGRREAGPRRVGVRRLGSQGDSLDLADQGAGIACSMRMQGRWENIFATNGGGPG